MTTNWKNRWCVLFVALATIAIGPACNSEDGDDGEEVTANDDDTMANDDDTANDDDDAVQETAFVFTTDYVTGGFTLVDLETLSTQERPGEVHSDAYPKRDGAQIAVVNRFFGDNVQFLNPEEDFATTAQYSTGEGSNPQDFLRLSPTKAYVTRYEYDSLLIMNPQTGEELGTIDLSAYADADGLPEMWHMLHVGEYVYIALQRLDAENFLAPTDYSLLAVVDPQTDSVVETIELAFTNPASGLGYLEQQDVIWVAMPAGFGVLDGGVQLIDPATHDSRGILFSEEDLGGDISVAVPAGDGVWFVIVSDTSFRTLLLRVEESDPANAQTLYEPPAGCEETSCFTLAGLAVNDRGEVWVGDRYVSEPGIRIFDAASGAELTPTPIDTGLPPADILFLP